MVSMALGMTMGMRRRTHRCRCTTTMRARMCTINQGLWSTGSAVDECQHRTCLRRHRSCVPLLHSVDEPTDTQDRKNSSGRTLNIFLPSCIHFYLAGHGTTKSAHPISSSGMKPTLENSARTTSSASSTLTCIRRWARCLWALRGCCQDITGGSSSRVGRHTQIRCPMSP